MQCLNLRAGHTWNKKDESVAPHNVPDHMSAPKFERNRLDCPSRQLEIWFQLAGRCVHGKYESEMYAQPR